MPLTSLPLEMILSFCTFLPEADSESLRNTCRGLRSALPPTPILNAPSNPPKHTNPHRRQWASPLQQPIFLLRLLRDMPSDTKRDLIVCRICISIRKRWIRSGDIQHPTKEEEEREGKEQDMTVYNNVDSVCEGCMWRAGRGYDEPETNPLHQSHTLHRLFKLLPPHERSHYIFCRRCVSISPISPLTTNSSTTNDAPGEAPSPPSLHSYTASNSLCNNCTQEYKRLCMTMPRRGHPTPAAISRKYHRGGRSIWHRNPKRM